MKLRGYTFLIAFFSLVTPALAQTLPVGLLDQTDDYFRRQQLLGKDSLKSSFMIRPIYLSEQGDVSLDDRLQFQDLNRLLWEDQRLKAKVYALSVVWTQQYNHHHPYGMNDGAMLPAKGYQTMLSSGVFAKLGPLSVQFRPEFVYARNSDFRETYEVNNGTGFRSAYRTYYNRIDAPERIGETNYTKFNLGQSSIRLNAGPVSAGVSNENLWWGPGIRSSLLMSNNAPGFLHFTFNTTKPITTPVGSFETQLVGGRLESSDTPVPASGGYTAKRDDWRYFSGFVFNYQPKWVPRLYLGIERTFMQYGDDLGNGFSAYFPVFSRVQKTSLRGEESVNRDQRLAFSARWVMPEEHAEIYFQFAKNDHNYNGRDSFVEPEHARAYVAGFRKLFSLPRRDTYIQAGVEVTQIESALTKTTRRDNYFYTHSQILHGYTHQGQVFGAGIGSGSNLQSIEVSWVRGLKRIGVQFERTVMNNDLAYRAFVIDVRRHWVDLGFSGKVDWDYKRFLFNAQLSYIRSLNYQWRLNNGDNSFWNWNKYDANNAQVRLGIMYRL